MAGLALPLSAGARLFEVDVNNNFFSPARLTVHVGDTVRWRNVSGFHNVFSCIATQTGCSGQTANESFTSGPPADPIWIYDYTFTEPGTNPYLCQSHATSMTGEITVLGAPALPPPVPDGSVGEPMTVAKITADGSSLTLTWDTRTCPAAGYRVLASFGSRMPPASPGLYVPVISRCDVVSPYPWFAVPDPSLDESGLIWWLIVADDGETVEGSWGLTSGGAERDGPGAGGSSGQCGAVTKDVGGVCR